MKTCAEIQTGTECKHPTNICRCQLAGTHKGRPHACCCGKKWSDKPVVSVMAYEHRRLRAVAIIMQAKDAVGERLLRKLVARMLKEGVKA